MTHGIATRSRSLPCSSRRLTRVLAALAVGCCLPAVDAYAQQVGPQAPAPQTPAPQTTAPQTTAPSPPEQNAAPAQSLGVIRSILVTGNERLEPETVRSYIDLRVGAQYDREALDIALKKLYGTDLFADVTIRDDSGVLTINVKENPVINRILFEGNKRQKIDKLQEEVRLAPRQIYTRSKVRADVSRIIELYRRSGRFAATIDPKVIRLPQNRVDLVFEINEGPKSKVRQINFLGNRAFSDGKLRGEIATRQARWYRFFSSNDSYDPDRTAYDREKLRQYYLTNGYADFRVVSATSELAPDLENFFQTFVVEEGEKYQFGKIEVDSKIRDLKSDNLKQLVAIKPGQQFNAKRVEDTSELLTQTAGLFGYAFADVRPRFDRDRENRKMNITFVVNEAPRVYVERININGNVQTEDKVIRREFRLAEGDAFNSFKVNRSRDRIRSLGYFQEDVDIEQKPGSTPDRVVLEVNVEEKSTGQLQLGAGFSSLESFLFDASISQSNFLGKGQDVRLGFTLSSFRNELDLSFTEPAFLGRNLSAGLDVFRRDFNSFRFTGNNNRDTTYEEVSIGGSARLGFPITEYWSLGLRYRLSTTQTSLDQNTFFTNGTCNLFLAGAFLCDLVGNDASSNRLTSSAGFTIAYSSLNSFERPTRGQRFVFTEDVAGLGGDVKYLRTSVDYDHYYSLPYNFVLRLGAEGGHIVGFGGDNVRITDRYFLGSPRFRGFRIRGVGPRSVRTCLDGALCGVPTGTQVDDSIGGKIYYLSSAEVDLPLGSAVNELGLRTSAYVDAGAIFGIDQPDRRLADLTALGVREDVVGDTPSPRVSVGIGVSWKSPFGPFRIDVARALIKRDGDQPEIFQFNVGTQF